jgi:hypothetical protein
MAKLTERQKELRKKYTRIAEMDCEYAPFLQIENQGFSVKIGACSKSKAEWYCDMVAIALDNLIKAEVQNEPR